MLLFHNEHCRVLLTPRLQRFCIPNPARFILQVPKIDRFALMFPMDPGMPQTQVVVVVFGVYAGDHSTRWGMQGVNEPASGECGIRTWRGWDDSLVIHQHWSLAMADAKRVIRFFQRHFERKGGCGNAKDNGGDNDTSHRIQTAIPPQATLLAW
jgi:hypothetical protein